jgi:hypothetical protein
MLVILSLLSCDDIFANHRLKEDDKVVTEGSFILKAEAVRQYPEFH